MIYCKCGEKLWLSWTFCPICGWKINLKEYYKPVPKDGIEG